MTIKRTSSGGSRALSRRGFLAAGAHGAAYFALARVLTGCNSGGPLGGGGPAPGLHGRLGDIGPLGEPLDIGLRIPQGFTARVIAQAGQMVAGTSLRWHTDPDGGATYATDDGGWIYVSNREFLPGGVSALRFDAAGEIVDGYGITTDLLTRINCGGGVTPWKTWMSGEEYDLGLIWECDPWGVEAARPLPALGMFSHEAAAVDPATNIVYETEDKGDGRFYRFVPDTPNIGGRPDLSSGRLQVMRVLDDVVFEPGRFAPVAVDWLDVPNPNPVDLSLIPLTPVTDLLAAIDGSLELFTPTRAQAPESTPFKGGEGIWYHDGIIYFGTKGDRRIWAHDPVAQTLACLYDDDEYENPILDSVDNIVITPGGDMIVVEDKSEANQQAVAITPDERILPLIELAGQEGSEVTGPAFSPDGQHFYFSSQRGPGANATTGFAGVTYCVSGPWFQNPGV